MCVQPFNLTIAFLSDSDIAFLNGLSYHQLDSQYAQASSLDFLSKLLQQSSGDTAKRTAL
jgi:hypothetical protein